MKHISTLKNKSLSSAVVCVSVFFLFFSTAAAQAATPLTAPTNLSAVAVSPQQINLHWTPRTKGKNNIKGHDVYRDRELIVAPTGSSTAATITISRDLNFANTALAADSTHTYTVEAYDSASPANFSAPAVSAAAATYILPSSISIGAYYDYVAVSPEGSIKS